MSIRPRGLEVMPWETTTSLDGLWEQDPQPGSHGDIKGDVVVQVSMVIGLSWGRRNRFMVLEHSTVLVYATEESWEIHDEPLEAITLSEDATVESRYQGEEQFLHLISPERGTITFTSAAGGIRVGQWLLELRRAIRRLGGEPFSVEGMEGGSHPQVGEKELFDLLSGVGNGDVDGGGEGVEAAERSGQILSSPTGGVGIKIID
ncbi:unnamed protein product, partial [Choristocarpus tenellus]